MYTKNQFIKTAVKRGYADRHIVQIWLKDHEQDSYSEEDLIEVYRFADREPLRNEPIKLNCADEEELKQIIRDSWL